MGGEQLILLEQRIEKAIKLIEDLKSREKKFANEKSILENKIIELQKEIESKDDLIEELKRSQRFLKEKIEVILDKLESIEILENSADFGVAESNKTDNENIIDSFNETKIIEDDNVVDLKEISEKDEINDDINKSDLEDSSGKSDNIEEENTSVKDEMEDELTAEKNDKLNSIVDKEEKSRDTSLYKNEKNVEESAVDNSPGENKSLEPEEDLKIINGGKSLFEEDVDSSIDTQTSDENKKNRITGGFLFKTGTIDDKINDDELQGDDRWFENNPFI